VADDGGGWPRGARQLRLHRQARGSLIAAPLPSLLGAVVYGALAVVIGAVALRWLLLPRCGFVASEGAPVARLAAKAGMAAAAVMLLAVPGRVALQLADFLEPGEAWRPALDAILFSTQSGKAAQLQMVWATAALLSFSVARSGRTRGWRAAGVTALVLALTPGLGGHPASSARPVLAMTFATMHVLALGMWIGTLFHLLRTARALSDRTLQVLLAAFHPVALGAVGVLVVSGAYASWTTLRGPADLTATPWGSLLLQAGAVQRRGRPRRLALAHRRPSARRRWRCSTATEPGARGGARRGGDPGDGVPRGHGPLDVLPPPLVLGLGEIAPEVPAARLAPHERGRARSVARSRHVEFLRHRPGVEPRADLSSALESPRAGRGRCGRSRVLPHHVADLLGRDLRRAAVAEGRDRPRGGTAAPRQRGWSTASRATRSANTSPSSSELEASRLAPCTPCARPRRRRRGGQRERPARSVTMPPIM
jgi:putative copper export protein